MGKLTDVLLGKSSLWPQGRSDVMPTRNTMLSSDNYGLPFVSFSVFKDNPYWKSLHGLKGYFDWFVSNPVFFAVVMIKAREYANMKFVVRNRRTGEIEPETTSKVIPSKIYKLLNRPNVLQKRWEFLMQRKIFREVCGNAMTYANAGMGMQVNINNIVSLMNVWPQYMEFKLAGGYFDATEITDIIESWRFKYGDYSKEFNPKEIFHQNAPNIDPRAGLIFGTPTAASLTRPLTNIDLAYESANVIMQNRGARLLFTSNKGDASGKIPLLGKEKDDLDEQAKEFGTLENQKQFWFSNLPLDVKAIEQDVRKLGLRDEIASDAMVVCNAFGVPEILLKLYLQGATFENQEASRRALYQGALIPESHDDIVGINDLLGLNDTDWMVDGSFDHVPALQQSKKDKAQGNKTTSEYMQVLFMKGAITMNQWLESVDQDPFPEGEKRIWEFTPEQISLMLGKILASTPNPNQPPPPANEE